MIYQQQHNDEELSLFEQPQQLLLLREHLTLLMNKYEQTKNNPVYFHSQEDINDPQLKQEETVMDLLHKIEQNEQQINELGSQMHTLAEITIKMLDYTTYMQEKRVEQVGQYEAEIQNLRGQLQHATHQNHVIEVDVEQFKQKLMLAQSQMEDIQRNQQLKQNSKEQDTENQRKIQLLELQLERISRQLNACKLNYVHKQPQMGSLDRIMSYNMSQKLIKFKRMSSVIMSTPFIQPNEMDELQKKNQILQQQNRALRDQIESFRQNQCQYQLELRDCEHEDQIFQEYRTPFNANLHVNKVTSASFMKSAIKDQSQIPSHNMVSHQSIEKFHTLSSQWSSKSFENNLSMFNLDSHLTNLIYLGHEQEDKPNYQKIPQTKETENSLPDSELNLINKRSIMAKCITEIGINTEASFCQSNIQPNLIQTEVQTNDSFSIQHQKEVSQKTAVQQVLRTNLSKLAIPLLNLKKRAVDDRISKVVHVSLRNRGV